MQETVVITGRVSGNQVNTNYNYLNNKETTSVSSTIKFDRDQQLVSEYQSINLNKEFPLNTPVKITFVVGNEDQ